MFGTLASFIIKQLLVAAAWGGAIYVTKEQLRKRVDKIPRVIRNNLGIKSPNDFDTLEEWQQSLAATEAGKEALCRVKEERERFFKNYRICKSKSGLQTAEEVAEAAGVSVETVKAVEEGKATPPADIVLKIAKAFGVSVEKLLEE